MFEDVTYKPKLAVAMIDESPKLIIANKLARSKKVVIIRDRRSVLREVQKEFGDVFLYQETGF